MMNGFSKWDDAGWFVRTGLLLLLAFLFAACGFGGGSRSASTPTPGGSTPTVKAGDNRTPTPGIGLGTQSCPSAVKDPAHWDAIIPTQTGTTKVESVTCAYLIGVPKLQAVVTVRHNGTGQILDVYV